MIELESLNDRVDIIGPELRVSVAVAGLLRQSVSPHVHCDQPVAVGQVRVQLPAPGKPALREAVDEQNRTAAGIARLDHVKPYTSAAGDRVMLHDVAPLL